MVKDALRECSSRGHGSQVLCESEAFSDRQVALDNNEGSSTHWFFTYHNTSSLGQTLVNTTHCIIRSLDFAKEDGFLETRFSSELGSVVDTTSCGDDLTTTSVDSISVKGHINNVELDTSHVFFSHDSFFGSPLEGSFHGVSDFIEELHSFAGITEDVWT